MEYNRRVKYWNLRHKNTKKDIQDIEIEGKEIEEKINKVVNDCKKTLSKTSNYTLRHPGAKVVDVLEKLMVLAQSGNEDARSVLGMAADRAGVEAWQRDWEWMTQADKDEAHLRKVYSDF